VVVLLSLRVFFVVGNEFIPLSTLQHLL
jgi:hypothetical protein